MGELNIQIDAERTDCTEDYYNNIKSLGDDLHQFTDNGNIGEIDTRDLITIKKSNSFEELNTAYQYFGGYNEATKDEMIEFLYNIKIAELLSRSWLNRDGIEGMLDITIKYEYLTVKGYSQGDVVDIIVPHILKDVWGCDNKSFLEQCHNGVKTEITHYFYDSPIEGEIELEFTFYRNCVAYAVEIERDEEDGVHISNSLGEWLEDKYEMRIDVDGIINYINREMNILGFSLLPDEDVLLRKEIGHYDGMDVYYPNCFCA